MALRWTCSVLVSALAWGYASTAAAQLAAPSARSSALAGSLVARARGYESGYWNPANLGLPDGPGWSFGLAGINTTLSNNSLTYSQLTDLYGTFLDDATKSRLLADIRAANPEGTLELNFELGGSAVGASYWRFGFTLASVVAADAELSDEAAELLLFGNDGEEGTGKDFDFSGSSAETQWLTGGTLSYGQPLRVRLNDGSFLDLALGASVTYGVAHGLARFDDRGSVITDDPLAVDVTAERVRTSLGDAGRFWSIGVGFAGQWKKLVAGISVQNLLGDIAWDVDDVELTEYRADADFTGTSTSDSTSRFGELPPAEQGRLRDLLDEFNVPTRLLIGGEYRVSRRVSLSADYRDFLGGRVKGTWDHTLAFGGEFFPLKQLPLLAGFATDFSQIALTAGAGLRLGVFHADVAIGRWGLIKGNGVSIALSASFWPSGALTPPGWD